MTKAALISLIREYRDRPCASLKEKTVQGMGEYLYMNLLKYPFRGMDEDVRSEFIVWLYPKLSLLLDRYDAGRSGFITYFDMLVHLSYRTFLRQQIIKQTKHQIFTMEEEAELKSIMEENNNNDWGMAAEEPEIPYLCRNMDCREKRKKYKDTLDNRQIFLLTCKAGMYVSDTMIKKVAAYTGYEETYIQTTIDRIRTQWFDRYEKLLRDREKRNEYYFRVRNCHSQMQLVDRESQRFSQLEKEYHYCAKRLEILQKSLIHRRRCPSNRFLAGILGISRGTIDTALATALQHDYDKI
ncbi:hypothetical protein K7I13_15145 [Brucepastera parasyntrophica]|uniref:hypothetical protein n=1 Tax=Brucepastera parasyntrophica TaxID=2880008 RepID=UPI00210A4C33|nr:hypothetical protein [Brucepastera parasyntrophica]ULQ59763.1 hypothetical protein K7I13_15145 [Brucepastera parasyntrophica]